VPTKPSSPVDVQLKSTLEPVAFDADRSVTAAGATPRVSATATLDNPEEFDMSSDVFNAK
jgi:hypothetical protein